MTLLGIFCSEVHPYFSGRLFAVGRSGGMVPDYVSAAAADGFAADQIIRGFYEVLQVNKH